MIRYREDMGVVEYSRTINSFKDEFPNLYHVSDLAPFSDEIACEVAKPLVTNAIREALDTAPGCCVVVVCAGWNAEPNSTSSMREAFVLRQLLQCKSPQDVLAWAKLNAGISHACSHGHQGLSLLPPMVYQTYMKDQVEA